MTIEGTLAFTPNRPKRPTAQPVIQLVIPQMSIPIPIPRTFMIGTAVMFPAIHSSSFNYPLPVAQNAPPSIANG